MLLPIAMHANQLFASLGFAHPLPALISLILCLPLPRSYTAPFASLIHCFLCLARPLLPPTFSDYHRPHARIKQSTQHLWQASTLVGGALSWVLILWRRSGICPFPASEVDISVSSSLISLFYTNSLSYTSPDKEAHSSCYSLAYQ